MYKKKKKKSGGGGECGLWVDGAGWGMDRG